MVAIRHQIVPTSIAKTRSFGTGNRKVGITVHETGNRSKGANAAAHANLQSRGGTKASWNWTVDDKEAVLSYPHEWRTWHAGAGSAGDGDDTIAIEICVNSDGDLAKAYRNAIELIHHILAEDKAVRRALYQHNHWSGKNCPENLRAATIMSWTAFFNAALGVVPVNPAPPVPTPPRPVGGTVSVNVGIGDPVTMDRIDLRQAKTGKTAVKGRHVDNLQGLLVAAGHSIAVDGAGGGGTRAALGKFQVATNTGDGKGNADYVCGAGTWRALIQA